VSQRPRTDNIILLGAQDLEHAIHAPLRIRLTLDEVVGVPGLSYSPVVNRIQLGHLAALLKQSDEGQEVRALQAVLVQILRVSIAGGDHHNAMPEEVGE